MSMLWIAVIAASVLSFAQKWIGYQAPQDVLEGPRVSRITTLLPVALLGGAGRDPGGSLRHRDRARCAPGGPGRAGRAAPVAAPVLGGRVRRGRGGVCASGGAGGGGRGARGGAPVPGGGGGGGGGRGGPAGAGLRPTPGGRRPPGRLGPARGRAPGHASPAYVGRHAAAIPRF